MCVFESRPFQLTVCLFAANLDSNAECASAVTSFRKKSLECVKLSLPSVEEELQRNIEKTLLSVCGVVSVSMIVSGDGVVLGSVS